jgi:hypothetical protein
LIPIVTVQKKIRSGIKPNITIETTPPGRDSAMIKNLHLTRVKWKSQFDYIFTTLERKLNGQECEALCEKYFQKHKDLTIPGEALWVDLRPAFEKPLDQIVPNGILAVPLDFTLPLA